MNRSKTIATRIAAVLLLAAPAAFAADMCGGPCSVSIGFASGGSISSPGGATITFGPGGSLVLGDGGSITLGEGGSITPAPAEGAAPDLGAGGSVVLGPDGLIAFGTGGSLATGDEGGVSVVEGSALDVTSAGSVTIDSAGSVQLGNLSTAGEITMTSGGNVTIGEPGPLAINLAMATGDANADITVAADGDLATGSFTANYVTITSTGSVDYEAGTITVPGDGSGSGGSGAGGSGGVIITGGGAYGGSYTWIDGSFVLTDVTINPALTTTASGPGLAVADSDNAAGSLGFFGLLVGLAALGRRRR